MKSSLTLHRSQACPVLDVVVNFFRTEREKSPFSDFDALPGVPSRLPSDARLLLLIVQTQQDGIRREFRLAVQAVTGSSSPTIKARKHVSLHAIAV
jgi:hypothetical protein